MISISVGGLLAPLLHILFPQWLFEKALIWSRVAYLFPLHLLIYELFFRFQSEIWLWKLKRRLRRLSKQKSWRLAIIKSKRLLSSCQPSRLLPLRRKILPYLPPEIWEKILDFTLHVPFVLDTSYDAANFHHFISSQPFRPEAYIPLYRQSETRRKVLRLVCKTWKELLDRRPRRWLYDADALGERINGVERVDLQLTAHFVDTHWPKKSPQGIFSPLETPEMFSVTKISIHDMTYQSDDSRTVMLHLFSQISRLHNLQALSYVNHFRKLNFTLSELQTHFSSLTCLYIEAMELRGSLQLERLEVLYLDVFTYDVGTWSLPNLRHLAVKRRGKSLLFPHGPVNKRDNNEKSPISPSSLHGLRSLLLCDTSVTPMIDGHFWAAYPQLECIGGFFANFTIVDAPPPNHPLYQVVNIGPKFDSSQSWAHMASLPNKLPNLRRIHMSFSRQNHSFPESRTPWVRIVQEHRQRGIVWLDRDGVEIRYKREIIQGKRLPLFGALIRSYSLTCCITDVLFCMAMKTWRRPFPFYESIFLPLSFICLTLWWLIPYISTHYVSPRYRWVCEG
jgi:hypothetical protein